MEVIVRKDLRHALREAMAIQGAVAVALIDLNSGMVLGRSGSDDVNFDVVGVSDSVVVRSKLRLREQLGLTDDIEDLLFTFTTQYHLIRTVSSDSSLYLYLVLNRQIANLPLARRSLAQVDAGLVV